MWMWCDSLGNIIEHLTQAERGMRAGGLGVQGVSGKVCNAKILQHEQSPILMGYSYSIDDEEWLRVIWRIGKVALAFFVK